MKQVYYSFIYPYLSYGTIITWSSACKTSWSSACKTSLGIILTKQNNYCVGSMFFAYSRGILKFEDVYKFKVALFTSKILNGSTKIPTISFHTTLTRASEIHTHNTRFGSKKICTAQKQIISMGPLLSHLIFALSKLWETILITSSNQRL